MLERSSHTSRSGAVASWRRLAIPLVLAASSPAWSDTAERRILTAPARDGGPSLAHVLATRRSTRAFAHRDLRDGELSQLVWAGQGASDGHRTVPSAGALYPLTLHVADARGVWRYVPADHALVRETADDQRAAIARAAFGQSAVHDAPAIIVITAELAITARKYGTHAERFATLEAGHAAQNILLTATALDLAAVPVGAFDDDALRRAIGVGSGMTPLYLIPIGAPST